MPDVHKIGTFTSGGRWSTLLDLNDQTSIAYVRDSFKAPASARQAVYAKTNRRYGGDQLAGEISGNTEIGGQFLLSAGTADGVIAVFDGLAAQLEMTRQDLFYRWQPDGATLAVHFALRGGQPWEPLYRWVEFAGARVLQVKAAWQVEQLAYGDPMTVVDDFSANSIGDYTFDAGTADVDAVVTGGVLTAVGTAPFSPLDLSPSLWLDVDSSGGLADNASITTYPDSSGNSNTMTGGGASDRPTYQTGEIGGKAVIRFDGTDYLTSPVSVAAKPFTFAAVVKVTDFSGFRTILAPGSASGGIHVRVDQTTGKPNLDKGGVTNIGTATTALTAGIAAVVVVTYSAAGAYAFYINGAAAGSGTNDQTFTANTAAIGMYNTAGSQAFLGDLGDVILIPALVTSGQRDSLTAYLGTKFGITVV